MVLVVFELEKEHIKLIKHLPWKKDDNNMIFTPMEGESPYGGLSLIEDCGLILFGNVEAEFDPLSPFPPQYSEEQQETIKRIYGTIPEALSVIHFTGKFEPGHYRKKWNNNEWKKFTPKK